MKSSEPSRVIAPSHDRRTQLAPQATFTKRPAVRLEPVPQREHSFRVLMVAAESAGIFQTGGLGHAVSGVFNALNEAGVETDLIVPHYLKMQTREIVKTGRTYRVGLDWESGKPNRESRFQIHKIAQAGPRIFLMGHATDGESLNYFDNRSEGRPHYGPAHLEAEAWGAWSRAVAEFILENKYDLVRLNDHHCALVALFLHQARREGRRTPRVEMVVHNLAFQGVYSRSMMEVLNIPQRYFDAFDGVEYYGNINFMKAGLLFSDHASTVSAQHARELATKRGGAGLDGLIRRLVFEKRFSGTLNGIESQEWDPANLEREHRFTVENFEGKARGKAELQSEFELEVNQDVPLFILTSRITEQKGFDYLPRAIERFLATTRGQVIAIGDGDAEYIHLLRELEVWYPDKFRYRPFNSRDEKKLTAFGDFFINAAWFEPSGLNQLFSLKNGTIPIVSRVGGLADSVEDSKTGFLFDIQWRGEEGGYDSFATSQTLLQTLRIAAVTFAHKPQQILKMRRSGMSRDNSWKKRVNEQMIPLFRRLLADRPAKETTRIH